MLEFSRHFGAHGRVRLADLGTAFQWLQDHGVDSSRLASVLGITQGHLRLLRHRSESLHFNAPGESLDALLTRPTANVRKRLGVRPHEDILPRWPKAAKKIEELEWDIDSIWQIHARAGTFSEGLEALQPYKSKRGYPSSALWLRFSARLFQHRAWFLVHSGLTTSAFEEAKLAIDLSHLAYNEREDPLDLRRLTESCLVASQACALGGSPQTSLKLLELAAQASERISDPLGSEHYRQRGVANLQLSPNAEIAHLSKYFKDAATAMERKQEHRSQGQLMMAGQRHLALLGRSPQVNLAEEISVQVDKDFPVGSLERAMMLNWRAACALSSDSPGLHIYAQELLQQGLVQSATFGHQATRAYLLSITPDIHLDRRFRRPWVYRALYENAYRTR